MSAPPPVPPRNLVAMIQVTDMARSLAFYSRLGFELRNTHVPDGTDNDGAPVWAWLEGGAGQLMLTKASEPVDAGKQGILFYLYFDDIAVVHARLGAEGWPVGPMSHPFYCPRGEFPRADPDGYRLMLTHT